MSEGRRLWGGLRIALEGLLSLLALAATPAATLALSALLGWASLQVSGQLLDWDTQLFLLVNGWSRPELTQMILLLLNDPGIDYVAIITPCLLYVGLRRRLDIPWAVIAVVATLVMGSLTIPYTQQYGLRERPFVNIPEALIDPEWRKIWLLFPTFPSGHMRETVGLSMVLGYFWPASRLPVAFYALFVAFTRLYLGAHYPTDIGAGMFIGVMDGMTALVAVNRVGWFLGLAGGWGWLRRAYAYVFVPRSPGRWSQDPAAAKTLRLALLLAGLGGGAALGGWAINYRGLRIIHDLMRNFDNSLTQPLLIRFDPGWAEGLYRVLGDGGAIYPVLGALVLLAAARGGWRRAARGVLVLGIAGLLMLSLMETLGGRFVRPLPFSQLDNSLPQEWMLPWAGPGSFPQRHILAVAALGAALGYFAKPLLLAAYAYTLAVAAVLLYFGAAWPTDILISLLVGQGTARYAIFLSQNLLPEAAEAPLERVSETEGEAATS